MILSYIEQKEIMENINKYSDQEKFELLSQITNKEHRYEIIRKISDVTLKEKAIISYIGEKNPTCNDENYWKQITPILEGMSVESQKRILKFILKNKNKYTEIHADSNKERLVKNLRFGLEIEYFNLYYEDIYNLCKSGLMQYIMDIIQIPRDFKDDFLNNIAINEKGQYNKWVNSDEGSYMPEISTPILEGKKESLEKINALCTILKAVGAETNHPECSLHINLDANYFDCNRKSTFNFSFTLC